MATENRAPELESVKTELGYLREIIARYDRAIEKIADNISETTKLVILHEQSITGIKDVLNNQQQQMKSFEDALNVERERVNAIKSQLENRIDNVSVTSRESIDSMNKAVNEQFTALIDRERKAAKEREEQLKKLLEEEIAELKETVKNNNDRIASFEQLKWKFAGGMIAVTAIVSFILQFNKVAALFGIGVGE